MAQPIYSTCFFLGLITNSVVDVVAAQTYTQVILELDFGNYGTPGSAFVFYGDSDSTLIANVQATPSPPQGAQWRGHAVIPPGIAVQAQTEAGCTYSLAVSGWALKPLS